jgi:hypothetical protein
MAYVLGLPLSEQSHNCATMSSNEDTAGAATTRADVEKGHEEASPPNQSEQDLRLSKEHKGLDRNCTDEADVKEGHRDPTSSEKGGNRSEFTYEHLLPFS